MADVAEVVKDANAEHVEKETTEKKVSELDGKDSTNEAKENGKDDDKPKENGKSDDADKKEAETNGESTDVAAGTKRKSGAGGDAPDGTPAEGATPEKKAKISSEEKEKESESRNGESQFNNEEIRSIVTVERRKLIGSIDLASI